jgi:hypothetical protein
MLVLHLIFVTASAFARELEIIVTSLESPTEIEGPAEGCCEEDVTIQELSGTGSLNLLAKDWFQISAGANFPHGAMVDLEFKLNEDFKISKISVSGGYTYLTYSGKVELTAPIIKNRLNLNVGYSRIATTPQGQELIVKNVRQVLQGLDIPNGFEGACLNSFRNSYISLTGLQIGLDIPVSKRVSFQLGVMKPNLTKSLNNLYDDAVKAFEAGATNSGMDPFETQDVVIMLKQAQPQVVQEINRHAKDHMVGGNFILSGGIRVRIF